MLGNVFEAVQIVGGLREGETINLVTSKANPRSVTTAIATRYDWEASLNQYGKLGRYFRTSSYTKNKFIFPINFFIYNG